MQELLKETFVFQRPLLHIIQVVRILRAKRNVRAAKEAILHAHAKPINGKPAQLALIILLRPVEIILEVVFIRLRFNLKI